MKTILLLASVFSSTSLFAASLTCAEIQQAEKDKTIVHSPFNSTIVNLPTILLRRAAVVSGQYTEGEIRKLTNQALEKEFKPVIDNVHIGTKEFHSVNIDLGDNSFIYLFNLNTQDYSGVASEDGTIVIDEEYCETQESDIL